MRYNSVYREMDFAKQHMYRLYCSSTAHAVICVFFSVWAMWFACPDGKTVFDSD